MGLRFTCPIAHQSSSVTDDGFERIFQVNVLAPYVLTFLIPAPARLIYLTSGLESHGGVHLDDLQFERRAWSARRLLAFAVARHWPKTSSNAVDPGWIKTRMGVQERQVASLRVPTRRCGWRRAMTWPPP